MKRIYKVSLLIVSVALASTLAYGIFNHLSVFFAFSTITRPSKETIEKNFSENKADFLTVIDYIDSLEYDSIRINSNDSIASVSDYETGQVGLKVEIDNSEVVRAIDYLFRKYNYNAIYATKSKSVIFQRWATRDKDCGIVYSFDGSEPQIEFMFELEPLSEPGWYYYVSDFDEYRLNQQK